MSTPTVHTDVPTGNTYGKYDTANPIERRMVEGFLSTLDRAIGWTTPRTVLEVGMGEGEVAERVRARFPDATVWGLDLPDPSLASEWRTRGLDAVYGDALRLPAADRSADLVLCIEVLEHVPDPRGALAEIARVARDRVVLSVPLEPVWRIGNLVRGRYVSDLGNTPGHLNHWSKRGFVRMVEQHLDVVSVHRPLPWTMIVARPRTADRTPR